MEYYVAGYMYIEHSKIDEPNHETCTNASQQDDQESRANQYKERYLLL